MRENFRQEQSSEMIYGTRAIIEAIKSGKELERLFIQNGLNNPLLRELKQILKEYNIFYQGVPVEKLNRLTRNNHQGVVGFISVVNYSSIEDVLPMLFEKGKTPLLLILDRITDTRNLGAIIRTAECAGVHAVIIPSRGSALINADTIKTSAGALHHINICREDNLKNTIDFIKDSGVKVYACSEKTNTFLYDVNFSGPMALILGNEENGVSPEYIKKCDGAVKIPMFGKVESLNVSVAAGMVLYEVMRQKSLQ